MKAIFGHEPADMQAAIAMEAMLENYPDGKLLRVMSFPNSNFSDPDNVPSGILSIHPVDADVHPDSVPDEVFEYLLVCPVHDPERELTDADFKGKEKLLASEIPQYSPIPPRLVGLNAASSHIDLGLWSPELGKSGYAGLFKKISPSGRDTDYFVVVKAGAPVACREFRRLAPRKFKDLMEDPNYNFVRHIAKRNAERLAYCAARVLGVKIEAIPDASALTQPHIAKPLRARGYAQEISSIEPISFNGTECAGVYHKVRSARKTADACYVMAGPYNGITIFNMRDNTTGYGTPVDTGVGAPKRNASESDLARRARGFTWEGKLDDHHPELAPGRYQAVDDAFLDKMKACGWRQKGVEDRQLLTPVVVKLGNPDLERK